jgi:small subunit ribosomal protein S17
MDEKGGRNRRKSLVGSVIGKSGSKTVKVAYFYKIPHPTYGKEIRRRTVIHVHDESNGCAVGDSVRVFETKPLSRMKRWRIGSILHSASNVDA